MKHTKDDLRKLQSLPLSIKIKMTQRRIRDWYTYWGGAVYVSFSGGKDSTVLLHLVREIYPDVEAVFVNTGLEYPEIQKFVKTFDNVTILRPKMRFDEVIKKYGYPVISKDVSTRIYYARQGKQWALYAMQGREKDGSRRENAFKKVYEKYAPLQSVDFNISHFCCGIMKESPVNKYEKKSGKKPIMGLLATESKRREQAWMSVGCNAFDSKRPTSKPMSFWTDQDVLKYIRENNIPIAPVYGDIIYKEDSEQMSLDDFGFDCGRKLCTTGCTRTGCIFCAFGAHLENSGEGRFERLKETHPRQYEYCIGGGEYVDGVWQPNKQGLGMGHVFDELNKIYGDGFIKY